MNEKIDEITMQEDLKSEIKNLKISRNMLMLSTSLMVLATGMNIVNLVFEPTISRAITVAGNTLTSIGFGMMAHLYDTKLNGLNNEYKKLVKY